MDEKQIGDLFDGCEGIGNACGPEERPEVVDFFTQFR